MTSGERRYRCPVCGRESLRSAADFPFCSDRCRLVDLGRWASGDYRIPGEAEADIASDASDLDGA
ncbi:MAG: DNA gyrase inhibitor YacG [Mariprofundaceae bacterium]